MSKHFTRLAVAICLLLAGAPQLLADGFVKREVRSVWMATVWALDWPTEAGTSATVQQKQKNEMISYLDRLKSDNFNTVYFQVRSMCDAMYRSSYEPWSSYLVGTRGKDPGWDPLAFVVEECHKRGLECHAWVNPYRWSTGSDWNTAQDKALKDAGLLLSYEKTTILNPGLPEARKRIVDVCREIARNYDVDGIVFDDYFYPTGIPSNSSAGDYELWKKNGAGKSFGDWRRANVNQMVADVYNMIQQEKPYLKFGISPAGVACSSSSVAAGHGVKPCPVGSDWQYNKIFSDPVAWLKEGTIDYISPQLYWETNHSSNPFGPLTKWWSEVAKQFGRHHYASHSISFLNEENANTEKNWQEVGRQLQASRDYTLDNAPGEVYYSAAYITGKKKSGLGEWLKSNKYQRAALTPAIDWKRAEHHDRVEALRKSGSQLTWKAVDGMRYSVYAIPDNLKYNQVQSTVTGGIMADYLVDISYENSYTLPSGYESGYYFAVCVLDRYGNEFEPRYTNESNIPAEKVTLQSPVDGAGVKLSAEFRWSAIAGGTYEINVAEDAEFKTLLVREYGLTAASYTADVTDFPRGKTFYWRVISSQEGRYDVSSDVASFQTLPYDPAEAAKLKSPADGLQIADLSKVDFSWNAAEGCSYTLFVSDRADMSSDVYHKATTATSLTVPIMSIGFSKKLYWRVATDKRGHATSYSDIWSFTTPTVPMAPTTEIHSPADGATVTKNFLVEFKRVDADRYTLQFAADELFEQLVCEYAPGWQVEGDVVRGSVPMTLIPEGTYYWRVATAKDGCEDTFSASRVITIDNNVVGGGSEEDYRMVQDKAVYPLAGNLQVSNMWVRSVRPEYSNISFAQNGALNRSFCVVDNVIYISARDGNSSDATCRLDKYNALTGAKIGSLTLPADVNDGYLPCNDVLKDGNRNIGVSNLSLNIAKTPLRIHHVDKESGMTTLAASCLSTKVSEGRVDHCVVYGNMSTGNMTVFAALGSGNKIIEWTVRNREVTEERVITVGSFYPKAENFGIAPRLFTMSGSDLFVNGGAIAPMRINMADGSVTDSFASNEALSLAGVQANGFAMFKFNKENYIVYPAGDVTADEGYRFGIAKAADQKLASMTSLWTVPQAGLGNVNSTTYDALVDYELVRSGRVDAGVNIYLYVPGNGLAAYSVFERPLAGVDDLSGADASLCVRYVAGEIVAGEEADRIEVYNLSGALVAVATGTDRLRPEVACGVYVVRVVAGGKVAVEKIAVR